MRVLKSLRIPNLLKLALVMITVSGVGLLFMVHQVEKPAYIKELTLPMNYQSANRILRTMERDKKLDIMQNDDASFKDLLNSHKNSLRKITSASQPSLRRKSMLNSRARSERSSIGKEKNGVNLDVQSRNTSLLDFQRRLTNNSRSFSDVNRQLSETKLESQRLLYTTKSSPELKEETKRYKQSPLNSEIETSRNVESKTNGPKNANFGQLKSFESNFESKEQNTFKTPYLSSKKSYKATTSSNSTINHGNQVKPTTLLGYDAKIKDSTTRTRSPEIQDKGTVNLDNETKPRMKQGNPKQKIVDDLRDSDKLPKGPSERSEHLKQNSTKAISNNRDNPKPKITNNLTDSDHLPKTIPEKVKTTFQQDSGNVVSDYQGNPKRKNTNNLRDTDQLPNASSKMLRSNRPARHSSNRVSNSKASSPPTKEDHIRNVNQQLTASNLKRKSLLIFGDDRSGTTFVTKMFAADPQMFTVYEPLWVTKKWFKEYGTDSYYQERVVRDVINALLSCKFTQSQAGKNFLGHSRTAWVDSGVFAKNVFRTSAFSNKTKSGRSYYPSLSKHPKFAEGACLNKFNHSVVKVGQVRVPGESISVFIPRVFRDNPETDIRVIQIVRDPRGSINSRIRSGWISDFTYTGFTSLARTICYKIYANIQFGRALKSEWLKERYLEVTYREITTMPITTAKKIYNFAGFQMPDSLIDWIVRSTNPDEKKLQQAMEDPYSHVRDSSKNYFKWRKESPIKRVRVIEEQCKGLLDLLGLEPVADEMEILRS